MPRKPGGYKNEAGKRVPGVTTITSRYGDKGGLLHWAWTEGVEGRNYRETRDHAANAGTVAHNLIECHLHGAVLNPQSDDKELVALGTKGFEAYLDWSSRMGLEFISTEEDLVSEIYQFGGCPDLIGRAGDQVVLADWKCSNGVYESYLFQIAAYRQLWDENNPDRKIDTVWLCRFEKEFGSFHHHGFVLEQMDLAFDGFAKLLDLYALEKRMKSWL